MKHPVPATALDDRLGWVGNAGGGKTYSAGTAVERLLAAKARVVIPDPLGVWYGLALDADGTAPSVFRKRESLVIFGGPHGDLPLNEHAGSLIGETVAGMAESCILDLSELGTKAAERRFMLAFLTALYKHKTNEPLHVIFDEADMWAPQRILDKEGEAMKLLGMMETVVRRGRVKGFIPWLITQRPAVLSKNVLSQVDGLIAFKLTSVQDRDAIGDWVEGQADKGQWKAMWGNMATLARGEGVVWIPARNILQTSQFPAKETFDSSRAPGRGERAHDAIALQPVNLDKLKVRLSKVEAETKANDPKALRAEIAKLKSEIQKAPIVSSDPAAIERATAAGFASGCNHMRGLIASTASPLHNAVAEIIAAAQRCSDIKNAIHVLSDPPVRKSTPAVPRAVPTETPLSPSRAKPSTPIANGEPVALTAGARKMLAVLDTNPPVRRTWTQVASLAGLKARGGSYNTAKKILSESGLIAENGNLVEIGTPSANAPSSNLAPADMVEMWAKNLSGAAPRILRHLYSVGGTATTQDIAEALGIQPRGGSWNTAWKELRDNEIVSVSGGQATLTSLFQPA